MNLKILAILILYYGIFSTFFIATGTIFTAENDYSSTININSSDITEDETATGVFDVLPDVGRFIAFVGFGIGLPEDTPEFFALTFALWQSFLTLFTIGFIISSIWDG